MQVAARGSSSLRRALMVALALSAAIWGQWAIFTEHLAVDAVVLFTTASALFAYSVIPGRSLFAGTTDEGGKVDWEQPLDWARAWSWIPLWLAAAVVAWHFSSGNRFRLETVLFWFAAVALYLWIFWERGGKGRSWLARWSHLRAPAGISLSWSAAGLLSVMAVAAFYRYYQIGSIPAEMTSDHAEKLLDIRDLLNGQMSIFFPRNTGREPLQFYLMIPFASLLGLGHVALKVEAATTGLLTVPIVYLIGKDMAGPRFGLLAALFLAISKWDFGIARVGLRAPLYPLFAAICLFFLLRALRFGRRNDYLLCGLATGVGLYGYSPFRAALLLIPALVFVKLAFERRRGWANARTVLRNTALCFGAIATVLIPLAHYMFENPLSFWMRALSRVSSLQTPLPADPLRVLLSNAINGFLMFNWRGDSVWANTVPYDPALDWVSGGLFVLGVVWCLHAAFVRREPTAAYLLVALVVLMLPSILSISFPLENPSVFRAGGATPVVALLVATPLCLSARCIAELWPTGDGSRLAVVASLLVIAMAARADFDRYFVDYASQYRQSAWNSSEIAAVIRGFSQSVGSPQNAYIKSWPHWVDTRNVAFNMGVPDWNNVLMTVADIVRHPAPTGNKLYVLNKADKEGVQALQRRFPEGQLREQTSAVPGQEFLVFFVPGSP